MSKREELAETFVSMLKDWIEKNERDLKLFPNTYFKRMEEMINAQNVLIQNA